MASPDLSLSHPSPSGAAFELAQAHSSPEPLKLYGGWFCPFVQRAWIVLVEKEIPHQYIEINPYHKAPEFLALNPRGLIPTLAVPGRSGALYESTVVCEFLDEGYPQGPRLMPEDAYERARCRLWINHVATRIVPAWYGVMQAQPDGEQGSGGGGGGGEEERKKLVEGIKAFAREMMNNDGGCDEKSKGDHSSGGPWFLGSKFSLVDVSLAPWAKRLWLIDYYKPGGTGIPKKGGNDPGRESGSEDEIVWDRWDQWLEAAVKRDSVVRTWSEDEKYIGVYKRYAENTTESEVARATRAGKGLP